MSPSGRFENNDGDGQENEDILTVGILDISQKLNEISTSTDSNYHFHPTQ